MVPQPVLRIHVLSSTQVLFAYLGVPGHGLGTCYASHSCLPRPRRSTDYICPKVFLAPSPANDPHVQHSSLPVLSPPCQDTTRNLRTAAGPAGAPRRPARCARPPTHALYAGERHGRGCRWGDGLGRAGVGVGAGWAACGKCACYAVNRCVSQLLISGCSVGCTRVVR